LNFLLLLVTALIGLFFSYYLYFTNSYIKNLNSNSKVVETSLGPIEYTLKGEGGPVLLFIHGTPGGYDQTTYPANTIRVLTPSRPGYLRTPLSIGKTPLQQAEGYKALIDKLGINKVVIMGVSGGGPSSMEFAARFPEITMGLIAFEAVSYSQDFREVDADIIQASDLGLWIQLSLISFLGNERLAASMLPNPNNRERLLSNPQNIKKLKALVWSIWPLSLRKEGFDNDYKQFISLTLSLEEISVPTLVIHGDKDINVGLNHAKESTRRIKGAKLHIIKEGDHMMSFTHSKEIDGLIEEFVTNVSKGWRTQ
jgi:pimeloyl-ACP methyl ester carboxylesterase|tara:strand:+ start:170 stop:1102 length:933 start_codon:yes stop_codon:yes gene_type:complete